MEAPEVIYLQQNPENGIIGNFSYEPIWEDTHKNIKFIRSDLAELTWEDIILLEELIHQVHNENPCGIGAEEFGEEVLNKFIENKNTEMQDCTTCKWGKYNDHWDKHFCYNKDECKDFELYEKEKK